ncbi:TIGR01244 family protein [Roseivivax lentus]|uniref:TIGR01244 family protein n=1 Tax=Roseivivax lentus TaxID=633194 RepID=A0A1N7PLG4_9RHOB|nr:TIGR01244 family sulfur transferase [Roseivivax lentus]SIT11307.1 TIGR01244 family protein [Roseivivax lentus]
MEPRQITDRYFVSPQIDAEDIADIKAAGFTRLICNRPDGEVPPSHQASAIGAAAEAAGLDFQVLPLTHQTMTPDNVAAQAELIDGAPGKVLAYCASGTRCSVVWALSRAGHDPVDEILSAAAQAGYDLAGLRPTLEAITAQSTD